MNPNKTKNRTENTENTKRPSTLKVQVLLDIEYELPPTRRNKIDIQKLLALELFRLGDPECNKLSYSDVEVLSYNYKINTNPSKKWTKTKNPNSNTGKIK